MLDFDVFNECVTNQQTNQQTDRQTDTAYYRDARTHLKSRMRQWSAEVYKKSRIWSDHRWRKFGGGITCVQWENSLRRLRGVAQRLQKLNKVDIFSLKMSKIELPPSDLISNFLLDFNIKHIFWACWIEKTCMEVTM